MFEVLQIVIKICMNMLNKYKLCKYVKNPNYANMCEHLLEIPSPLLLAKYN